MRLVRGLYISEDISVKSDTNPSSVTWDVVDLAAAVVLQSVAAASSAAAVLSAGHPHQAARHRQLGGLSEVRQHAPCRVREAALQRRLRLGGLGTGQTVSWLQHEGHRETTEEQINTEVKCYNR